MRCILLSPVITPLSLPFFRTLDVLHNTDTPQRSGLFVTLLACGMFGKVVSGVSRCLSGSKLGVNPILSVASRLVEQGYRFSVSGGITTWRTWVSRRPHHPLGIRNGTIRHMRLMVTCGVVLQHSSRTLISFQGDMGGGHCPIELASILIS